MTKISIGLTSLILAAVYIFVLSPSAEQGSNLSRQQLARHWPLIPLICPSKNVSQDLLIEKKFAELGSTLPSTKVQLGGLRLAERFQEIFTEPALAGILYSDPSIFSNRMTQEIRLHALMISLAGYHAPGELIFSLNEEQRVPLLRFLTQLETFVLERGETKNGGGVCFTESLSHDDECIQDTVRQLYLHWYLAGTPPLVQLGTLGNEAATFLDAICRTLQDHT